jgi:hypothetical protein
MKLYYKYLPIERQSYFKDELIRYTQPIDLNDPFECLPEKPTEKEFNEVVEKISGLLPKMGSPLSDKAGKLNLKEIYRNAYKNVNNDIGILSLTKNWNNTLMWAHYTISHKGFCIGFDPNDNYFKNYLSSDKEKSKTVKDVIYSDKRVKIPMELGQKRLEFEPYITKSKDWEYEEEVRVIATLNLSDKKIEQKPVDIHLFKLPHRAIKEIIVGVNINEKVEDLIKKFCIEKGIKFFKSKISDKYFDMERA